MAYLNTIATDLIYHIMLRIHSRADLRSFILSCQWAHETFKEHPTSILRHVVCNEFDIHPDSNYLPFAWEVVRLQRLVESGHMIEVDLPSSSGQRTDGGQISDICSGTQWKAAEYERLGKNHNVILGLAKKFSIRFKETSTLYDSLSVEEFRRFERTAYTFWRLQLQYHARVLKRVPNSEENGHERLCADVAELDTCDLLRLEAFQAFLLEEVQAMERISTHIWALQAEWGLSWQQCRHHVLSIGLDKLDRLYEVDVSSQLYRPSSEFQEHLWLADALEEILESRKVDKATREDANTKLVLEQGNLVSRCQSCRGTLDLSICYNVTNPDDIERTWSITDFPGWWFSKNPIEMDRVCRRILGRPASGSTEFLRNEVTIPLRVKALTKILEHATKRATQSRNKISGMQIQSDSEQSDEDSESGSSGDDRYQVYRWKPYHVLCATCFRPILQKHFYEWWLKERKSDRVEQREWQDDCWWGKNCRTQRKREHAHRLNHCCPQTRASSPLA